MDQQFIPTAKPTIEDVRQRFEQWRESRKQRTPIPASLWEGAASLCADHSIYKISRSLHLEESALKIQNGFRIIFCHLPKHYRLW